MTRYRTMIVVTWAILFLAPGPEIPQELYRLSRELRK